MISVVILLSFLYNYDNLTLKLLQGKCSYTDEGWFLLADSKRFKVESVPGINIALKASKTSIKIHHEYDAWLLIVLSLLLIVLFINKAA